MSEKNVLKIIFELSSHYVSKVKEELELTGNKNDAISSLTFCINSIGNMCIGALEMRKEALPEVEKERVKKMNEGLDV